MDIKEKIDEIIAKIKDDPSALEKFGDNPAGAIKDLTGADSPEEDVNALCGGIISKLDLGSLGDTIGSLFGKKD